MFNFLTEAMVVVIKFLVVLSINVSLFLIVPVSNSFLAMLKEDKKKVVTERRVVAELVRPKEVKQQSRPKSRVRTVSNASSQAMQDPMQFKFTPDLSVAGAGDGAAVVQQQQLEAEVFEEGDVDENATPVAVQAPPYPDRARELAVEGTVVLTFVVNEDGKVGTIEDIQAPHPSFAAAFRNAMRSWKFSPAKNKGVPVKQRVRWPVDYVLD